MTKEKLEARREAKKLLLEQKRVESEKNQKPVKQISISIEWKKSYIVLNILHSSTEKDAFTSG